jgi:hypothetical protein
VERLNDVRRNHPNAGGLVIATDQDHARGIAEILKYRFRVSATVVTSDDPDASDRISTFSRGNSEWLVAVRMVSEGVDIPRLRVGVYATITSTDLFFRQAVGRFVRWTPGVPNQRAWLFLPDDVRLRARAFAISEQRRHSIRRDPLNPDQQFPEPARQESMDQLAQMSLFAPLSAVATETPAAIAPWHEPFFEEPGEDVSIELELAPPPPIGQDAGPADELTTRREAKDQLRNANAEAARDIARKTGMPHAQVNIELNRRSGIQRINDATVQQLQARLKSAESWLARL